MKSSLRYLILLLTIFFGGCHIRHQVAGQYMARGNPNYFMFKNDGTFIYEYKWLHLYQQSTGKWRSKDRNIISISSEIGNVTVPLIVSTLNERLSASNKLEFKLRVKEGNNLKDYICNVKLNDTNYMQIRCDSLSMLFLKEPIKSLLCEFYREPQSVSSTYLSLPLITKRYVFGSEFGNNLLFEIEFEDRWFYYKTFNDSTVVVGRNSIKLKDSTRKKDKLHKVPDSLRIFSRYDKNSQGLNVFQ